MRCGLGCAQSCRRASRPPHRAQGPAWLGARQPDARPWAPSAGRGHLAGLYNGIISGQPPLQKLSMLPVLIAAAQTVRFPTASDTLTSTWSPDKLCKCLKLLLSWDLQTLHAVMYCIFSLVCHDRQDHESRREREQASISGSITSAESYSKKNINSLVIEHFSARNVNFNYI